MVARNSFRRRTQAPRPVSLAGDDVDGISCEKCGSGDREDELLLCDKCDRGYHLFCLRPILVCVPKGTWFCSSCSNAKKLKRFPLIQTKIVDFFRIQRSPDFDRKPFQDNKKNKRRLGGLIMSKKKRKLLPFSPSEDSRRRLEQMASLATALMATGTKFSDELTYMPGMARRSANQASLEPGGMQVLSREDSKTLEQCKDMMKKGQWPPLMVVFDSCEGFTVHADRFIKDLTIITEYTGDVDYLKNRQQDDGDSMMTLISASDPSNSLVICPDKHGNIARFISGINNHTHVNVAITDDQMNLHWKGLCVVQNETEGSILWFLEIF
ncbi:histone-lysine N-methyltransferase ATXR6-like isoform X2 [Aristolochia californica]|uniref:histone-lysine N-methyltransferase ATXR6-like isoform X2 n=1 Tax=Aristolochia californica TaxID=171875 RepID=UPI0035D9958F